METQDINSLGILSSSVKENARKKSLFVVNRHEIHQTYVLYHVSFVHLKQKDTQMLMK